MLLLAARLRFLPKLQALPFVELHAGGLREEPFGAWPVLDDIVDELAITTAVPPCVARLSPDGRAAWGKFYLSWDAARARRGELLDDATVRIPSYVLKLAIAYSAVEATLPEI